MPQYAEAYYNRGNAYSDKGDTDRAMAGYTAAIRRRYQQSGRVCLRQNLPAPGLEVRRLFDFVRDDVTEATGRKQTSFSYGSISGRQDFYFVAGK